MVGLLATKPVMLEITIDTTMVYTRSFVNKYIINADAMDDSPTVLFFLTIPMATHESIIPTPAIIPLVMTGPMELMMNWFIPNKEITVMIAPPKKIIESLSRRLEPMVPARVMVSAWKDIGGTRPNTLAPTAPMEKASAVGREANPNDKAKIPWGKPLIITPIAAIKSLISICHAPFPNTNIYVFTVNIIRHIMSYSCRNTIFAIVKRFNYISASDFIGD